jgi:hypothetical protein
MNAARIEKSDRLQRVDALLRSGNCTASIFNLRQHKQGE